MHVAHFACISYIFSLHAQRCAPTRASSRRLGSKQAVGEISIATGDLSCKHVARALATAAHWDVIAGYADGARGSVNQKALPAPGALLTPMAPPWCSMIWRLMYSPRPRLALFVVWA